MLYIVLLIILKDGRVGHPQVSHLAVGMVLGWRHFRKSRCKKDIPISPFLPENRT